MHGGTVELITDVPDYFDLAQRCLAGDPGLELRRRRSRRQRCAHLVRAQSASRAATHLHRSVHRRR